MRQSAAAQFSAIRTLGKLAFAFAPLASPAIFAWSLGAIIVHDLWRIAFREQKIVTLVSENAVALGIALLIFALSV